jgi:hypothetical protein
MVGFVAAVGEVIIIPASGPRSLEAPSCLELLENNNRTQEQGNNG